MKALKTLLLFAINILAATAQQPEAPGHRYFVFQQDESGVGRSYSLRYFAPLSTIPAHFEFQVENYGPETGKRNRRALITFSPAEVEDVEGALKKAMAWTERAKKEKPIGHLSKLIGRIGDVKWEFNSFGGSWVQVGSERLWEHDITVLRVLLVSAPDMMTEVQKADAHRKQFVDSLK